MENKTSADIAAERTTERPSPEVPKIFQLCGRRGKTYASSDYAAHMEKAWCTDVAVGYIKPNAHPQTWGPLNGLKLFPPPAPNIMELRKKSLTLIKP